MQRLLCVSFTFLPFPQIIVKKFKRDQKAENVARVEIALQLYGEVVAPTKRMIVPAGAGHGRAKCLKLCLVQMGNQFERFHEESVVKKSVHNEVPPRVPRANFMRKPTPLNEKPSF